jgi:hypothetical protein
MLDTWQIRSESRFNTAIFKLPDIHTRTSPRKLVSAIREVLGNFYVLDL